MSDLVETHELFTLAKTEENLKKLMARTVEAYPIEWIVIHETLQNARDAIQKSENPSGNIRIVLDVSNERVTVQDNGRGFPHDISLLGIGGTDKDQDDWHVQGNQGVGLKAVLLSTNDFRVESVINNMKWVVTCKNACNYLQSQKVELVEETQTKVEAQNGTIVSYTFPTRRVSDFVQTIYDLYAVNVSKLMAENPIDKLKIALEWYFRTYSYAGDINRLIGLSGIKEIDIELKIVHAGVVPEGFEGELKTILEKNREIVVRFKNKHWDIKEAVSRVKKGMPKPRILEDPVPDGGKIVGLTEKDFWTRTFLRREDFQTLLINSSLKEKPNPSEYEYLFSKFLGITVVIGALAYLREFMIENPRRFIAANGIPSSHLIRDPTKGGELTYNRDIHFIVNLNARLNYGKQNIADHRLLGRTYEFYTDAYRATLKNIAKSIVGMEVTDRGAGGYADRYQDRDVNVISRPNLPLDILSFKKEPRDENAVIGLFYELIGHGYLKGYYTYSLHGSSRYDGKMILMHSGLKELPKPQYDNELAILEFKQKTTDVIDDFENDRKIPKEIHLLVVWENDFEEDRNYQIVNIEYTPDDARRFDRVKSCLKDRSTGWHIQVLVLKEVIKEILGEQQTA